MHVVAARRGRAVMSHHNMDRRHRLHEKRNRWITLVNRLALPGIIIANAYLIYEWGLSAPVVAFSILIAIITVVQILHLRAIGRREKTQGAPRFSLPNKKGLRLAYAFGLTFFASAALSVWMPYIKGPAQAATVNYAAIMLCVFLVIAFTSLINAAAIIFGAVIPPALIRGMDYPYVICSVIGLGIAFSSTLFGGDFDPFTRSFGTMLVCFALGLKLSKTTIEVFSLHTRYRRKWADKRKA